jgi:hypothetical protein
MGTANSYKRSIPCLTPAAFAEAYLPPKGGSAMNRLQWLQMWGFNAIPDRRRERPPADAQKFAALMRRLSDRTQINRRTEEAVEV